MSKTRWMTMVIGSALAVGLSGAPVFAEEPKPGEEKKEEAKKEETKKEEKATKAAKKEKKAAEETPKTEK